MSNINSLDIWLVLTISLINLQKNKLEIFNNILIRLIISKSLVQKLLNVGANTKDKDIQYV